MSIIIPNMKMPSCCSKCDFQDDSGDYPVCFITGTQKGYNFLEKGIRMENCPIKELSEQDLWLTGIPTEDGLYVIVYKRQTLDSFEEHSHYQLAIFREGRWEFDTSCKIVKWLKIETIYSRKNLKECPYCGSKVDYKTHKNSLGKWSCNIECLGTDHVFSVKAIGESEEDSVSKAIQKWNEMKR